MSRIFREALVCLLRVLVLGIPVTSLSLSMALGYYMRRTIAPSVMQPVASDTRTPIGGSVVGQVEFSLRSGSLSTTLPPRVQG